MNDNEVPESVAQSAEVFGAAIQKLLRDHQLATETLTEDQLVSVIRQALISGDLMRHVRIDTRAQTVSYLPYREVEALREKLRNLESLVRSEWRHAGDRLNELFRSVDPL